VILSPVGILLGLIDFYVILIIVYVLMSWFPKSGIFEDVYRVLGSVVEPYVGLFRRIIPPLGMVDVTPIVALLVLQYLIVPLLVRLAGAL
jgi:YggT family protein